MARSTITVGGVDICSRFGLVLTDESEFSPPEPKAHIVEVPGGGSDIDLTDSLGMVGYSNREHRIVLATHDVSDFEMKKTEISNMLHGRRLEYQLSFDPGYTYTGRFSVSEYRRYLGYATVSVDISADPWKSKGIQTYRIDAAGGKMFRFESGRKPVRPTIECSHPVRVTFEGKTTNLPSGTWRLNDVLFTEGWNELYINSYEVVNTCWYELGEGGDHAMTWDEASKYRWDELRALNGQGLMRSKTWEDLANTRWEELAGTRWSDLRYMTPLGETNEVYLTYDWGDL